MNLPMAGVATPLAVAPQSRPAVGNLFVLGIWGGLDALRDVQEESS